MRNTTLNYSAKLGGVLENPLVWKGSAHGAGPLGRSLGAGIFRLFPYQGLPRGLQSRSNNEAGKRTYPVEFRRVARHNKRKEGVADYW